MLAMVFWMAIFEPSPISVMAMTAPTPMITPRAVRADRILLRRSAPKAVRNVGGSNADAERAARLRSHACPAQVGLRRLPAAVCGCATATSSAIAAATASERRCHQRSPNDDACYRVPASRCRASDGTSPACAGGVSSPSISPSRCGSCDGRRPPPWDRASRG